MEIHFRDKPRMLIGLPRLVARLPVNSVEREEFEQRYQRIQVGYSGELKVDDFLESLNLPSSTRILKNIELSLEGGQSFQIDLLVISEKYILLFEVKNIAGELTFESNPNQLVRNLQGRVTKMDCPVTQLLNTKSYLERWLKQRGYSISVMSKIIWANQQAFIKVAPENASVIFMKEIPLLLKALESYPEIMNLKDIEHLIESIKRHQVVYNPFPLREYFRINEAILKKNQLCPTCHLTLHYVNHKTRFCSNCQVNEKTDYEGALQDWFIVFGRTITSKECQEFLGLSNRHQAKYAIRTTGLKKVGKSVATKYIWPPDKPFK